jgi:hypothetical protein
MKANATESSYIKVFYSSERLEDDPQQISKNTLIDEKKSVVVYESETSP